MTDKVATRQKLAKLRHRCRTPALGLIVLLLIVVAVVLLGHVLPFERAFAPLQVWIAGHGVLGAVAFALIYTAATILLLPGWVLTVAAGALFGLLWGTIIVSLASTTSVGLTFLISRYLARDRVTRWMKQYPKFEAVDQAVGREGWKIVALLRLSPAVPFNLQNYLYGLTAIRFWPCVLASWVAMLPGTVLYVYLGYLGRAGLEVAAEGSSSVGVGAWALRIVGLVATLVVTVYTGYLARRAIRERTVLDREPRSQD